LNICLI